MKKEKAIDTNTLLINLIGGVEGNSISIAVEGMGVGRRIAGPKPWGGGNIIKTWRANPRELIKDIQREVKFAKKFKKEKAKP